MDSIAAEVPAGVAAQSQLQAADEQVAGHLFNLNDFDNLFTGEHNATSVQPPGLSQNSTQIPVVNPPLQPNTTQLEPAMEQDIEQQSSGHRRGGELFRKSRRLLQKDEDDSSPSAKSLKLAHSSSPRSSTVLKPEQQIQPPTSSSSSSTSVEPTAVPKQKIEGESPEAARLREEERVRLRNRNQARRARQRRRQAVEDMEKKLHLLEHENQVLKNAFRTLHMQHTLTEALVVAQCGESGQSVVQQMRALTQAKQCSLPGLATELLVPAFPNATHLHQQLGSPTVTPILPHGAPAALGQQLLQQALSAPPVGVSGIATAAALSAPPVGVSGIATTAALPAPSQAQVQALQAHIVGVRVRKAQ
jgi:hypothetical protein